MPFLIDGNNLVYALRNVGVELGRRGLRKLLEAVRRRGGPPFRSERVCVVFDGPAPRPFSEPPEDMTVEAIFAAPASADDVILDEIDANSAPRRLTVVSTDRELRRAARRRRCKGVTSEDFADELLHAANRPEPTGPREPAGKHSGRLSPEETKAWLREFGLEDVDDDPMDLQSI